MRERGSAELAFFTIFEVFDGEFIAEVDDLAGLGEFKFFGVHEVRIADVILIATDFEGGISVGMQLTAQQRAVLEEELIDVLIAWKKKTDAMRGDIVAAREAMAKAYKFKIWEGKYGSFKEWLEQECGISRSWAYEMIGTAKTIEAIEDVASTIAEPEKLEEVKQTVRALPTRQLKKLKALKPLKAAELVKSEMLSPPANGQETELIKGIEAAIEEDKAIEAVKVADSRWHLLPTQKEEVLKAVEAEWATLRRGMAYVPVTPEGVYLAIKGVLEKVL